MTAVLLTTIVFFAALVQTISGFGFALVVMPLATILVGLQTAAPLVALTGLTVCTVNFIRYRQAVNVSEVLRLAVASALGIPFGLWVLTTMDESTIKSVLGLILIAYALYVVVQPAMPSTLPQWWVYPTGFVAGCLSGAYNTPGPPVIMYGSLRQWPKQEFRAVLQMYFAINATLVVSSHALARRLTAQVLSLYPYAALALLLGVVAGSRLDTRVDRNRFRSIVTVMILILGVSLLLA
jgi:uncharacterized membrane protein YfcA